MTTSRMYAEIETPILRATKGMSAYLLSSLDPVADFPLCVETLLSVLIVSSSQLGVAQHY